MFWPLAIMIDKMGSDHLEVTSKINIDLSASSLIPQIYAVQGDANTRVVQISLWENGIVWDPPSDAKISVSYKKPNGSSGSYSTLQDGSAACIVIGNQLSVTLTPVVLTTPGQVNVSIVFMCGEKRIATFPFGIIVAADPAADASVNDYEEGYKAGKQEQYDAFWDKFQENGTRAHYYYAFAFHGWNDTNYNPKYPITPTDAGYGLGAMFQNNTGVTDTKVPITAYGYCELAFAGAQIKRIPKLIFSGTTSVGSMFTNCAALEELYCEGELTINGLNLQHSTKLNKASIESIINALSTTTSGLSITLSQTAVTNAFGSTTATEWTTLVGTRSNWTISLV